MDEDDVCRIFDLNDLTIELHKMLTVYEAHFSPFVSFGNHRPLQPVPGKGYSARTAIPVFYDARPAGTLYAIMFRFQDGTGDESAFKTGQLELPEHLTGLANPKKLLPRAKTGVYVEAVFPFFTAVGNNRYLRHVVSLEELTVDDPANPKKIVKMGELGLRGQEHIHTCIRACIDNPDMSYSLDKRRPEDPLFFLTCGYRNSKRFGDPHSIYCATKLGVQVAGFLAVPERNGLAMLLERNGG